MAVRAVHDLPAPALAQPGDLGQLVDEPGGHEQPPPVVHGAVVQGHDEVAGVAGRRTDPTVDHLDAVAAHLVPTDCEQLERVHAVAAEEAVHTVGGCVARVAGVDHEHRAAGAAQVQGPAQSGRATADHDHVMQVSHGIHLRG